MNGLHVIFEGFALGVVAYRVWRFVGVDTITEPLRGRMRSGWSHFFECPWCAGTHIAVAVAVAVELVGWADGPWLLNAAFAAVVVGLLGERS